MTSSNPSIFINEYRISSLFINTKKQLGLFGLLGLLQDAAAIHANQLDFGYEASLQKGFFWVLVRQKLRMEIWPKWNDVMTIKTWTKPVFGFYAVREYELFLNNKKIGDCATTWMILDSESRKPKNLENANTIFQPETDLALDYSAERVAVPAGMSLLKNIRVSISDLDMNEHVNNVKYSQWVLDAIPLEHHHNFIATEYEINFSAETFINDEIEMQSNLATTTPESTAELFFQGIRKNDGKIVFTSRIQKKMLPI